MLDGSITVQTKGAGGEGIESKETLTVNGGTIVIRSYEDGTNSTSHTYINGGSITVTTGTGDAIDSNGNIYVNGGRVVVVGASSPELRAAVVPAAVVPAAEARCLSVVRKW